MAEAAKTLGAGLAMPEDIHEVPSTPRHASTPHSTEDSMQDILRSIRDILGDDAPPTDRPRFPQADEPANHADNRAAGQGATAKPSEPPLAFLRRKNPATAPEPTMETAPEARPEPPRSTLAERLERHRQKAEAEREALRRLTARAKKEEAAPVAEPQPVARQPQPPVESSDIDAPLNLPPQVALGHDDSTSSDDLEAALFELEMGDAVAEAVSAEILEAEPVAESVAAPVQPPASRFALPDVEAERVDYSGGPHTAARPDPRTIPTPPLVGVVEQPSQDDMRAALRGAIAERSDMLDATIREMLRPLVAEWLDDNLPALVERVVREEIEHVSRGPQHLR